MARPIRNTPILFGDDARQFNLAAENVIPETDRIIERERIQKSVENFQTFLTQIETV